MPFSSSFLLFSDRVLPSAWAQDADSSLVFLHELGNTLQATSDELTLSFPGEKGKQVKQKGGASKTPSTSAHIPQVMQRMTDYGSSLGKIFPAFPVDNPTEVSTTPLRQTTSFLRSFKNIY